MDCPDHDEDWLKSLEEYISWTFLPYGGDEKEEKDMRESETWEDVEEDEDPLDALTRESQEMDLYDGINSNE